MMYDGESVILNSVVEAIAVYKNPKSTRSQAMNLPNQSRSVSRVVGTQIVFTGRRGLVPQQVTGRRAVRSPSVERLEGHPRSSHGPSRFGIYMPPNESMCCGTWDHASGTGTNCATVHPFTTCVGILVSCPNGEEIRDDGGGKCL